MTREEVIELAREAGIIEGFKDVHPSVERFAQLIEKRFMDKLIANPAICRQIIDAGLLSSNPAGFKARGLK